MAKTFVTGALLVAVSAAAAAAQQNIDTSMYPKPAEGLVQHVLPLPPQDDESRLKVELVAGKTMSVDCNHVMIGADLDEETVQGWGYTYFVIDKVGPAAATLMACPDGSKTDKFIELNLGEGAMQRYNSKLPLVIHAPADLQVGYRIWSTDGTFHTTAR